MKLLVARIRIIIHCLKTFHTDVTYRACGNKRQGKILKIKCKECGIVFYENFYSPEDKAYFENEIEDKKDEN